jgi:hypothetical protein
MSMVTGYPQRLTATSTGAAENQAASGGLLSKAIGLVGQMICGFRGHDSVLHFEGNRVMMRCTSCGHDSPGWEISGRAPRRRYEGDARRHSITKQRLVLRKSA